VITAQTRVLALLGHPVGHSRSPSLHNGWLTALGIDAVYVALDCGPAVAGGHTVDPAALVRAGLWGANVTIPLKQRCTPDRLEAAAQATGAVNTLYWEGDQLVGANTDAEGFRTSTEAAVGSLAGRRCLILGAGGAARAVVHALREAGVDRIDVANRRQRDLGVPCLDLAAADPRPYDLVVNTLPAGGRALASGLPLPEGPGAAWVDLNYWDDAPPQAAAAAEAGVTFVDGHGMLEAQARASFLRWTGQEPPPLP